MLDAMGKRIHIMNNCMDDFTIDGKHRIVIDRHVLFIHPLVPLIRPFLFSQHPFQCTTILLR